MVENSQLGVAATYVLRNGSRNSPSYKLVHDNGQLVQIRSKRAELNYKYLKNRTLASVQLKVGKNKYSHDLGSKKSPEDAIKVGEYLDSLYESMGELYNHSQILRGVLP